MPNFRAVIAVATGPLPRLTNGLSGTVAGNVIDALSQLGATDGNIDAYVAGPSSMMPNVMQALLDHGIRPECIHMDSFGA